MSLVQPLVRRILRAVQRPGRDLTADLERVQGLLERGHRMHLEGELTGAERCYRQAVELMPEHAAARHMLGALLGQRGSLHEARQTIEHAVRTDPQYAPAWIDLGNVLRLQEHAEQAAECYRKALAADPGYTLAAVSLGELLLDRGDASGAVDAFARALASPADARAVKGTVAALEQLDRLDDAKRVCEQVLAAEPEHAEAHASLGYLLLKREFEPQSALGHLDRALMHRPDDCELHANRGIALQNLHRFDEAIGAYETANRIDSKYEVARFHRSLALLAQGKYESAWPDYELRLISEDSTRRPFPYPRWNGESLAGKTLLVTAEQGIGDEILFASCVPDLLARAGHVIIECSQKLEPIFRRSFPAATVRGGSQLDELDWLKTLPHVDLTCPIGSLPMHLRRSAAAFPSHSAYLQADPRLVDEYRERLQVLGRGLKVGLSWRGGTVKTGRAVRSLGLEQLLPVLRVPGVHFVDLQYDDAAAEIEQLQSAHGCVVHHWRDALVDYDRTAALLGALDVVVSVCTAVNHLGGALGRPVWVMTPFASEWRYGAGGETMVWFPSVTVIRQPEPRLWRPVIERVRTDLEAWAARKAADAVGI